ncbi:MAG: extracellular solute-binding protein [Lentisphaeria bacterium]|nr:extracellular solute-binding protein [Lentisphaeria bacterium]
MRTLPPLACASVAALLLGCGKPPADTASPKAGAPPATITLSFWHIMNYSGPEEILAEAVQRFEHAYPDTRVEIQAFENDAYKTKLAIEMASGTPPDILFTWGGGPLAQFAASGHVADLTEALSRDGWRDRFIDQALGICTVRGRVFAVPLDLSAVVLWYNRELMQAHGVKPPETYDDLLDLCGVFHRARITPFALGNMKQWPGAFYFIYLANRCGGTELFLDAADGRGGATFDASPFVEAGERLQRLVQAHAFPVGFNGVDVGMARSRFLQEDAAMYLMGTWMVARAQAEKADFLAKLDCVPFPGVPGGKGSSRTVVGGVNCGFAVAGRCPHPERAIELLRFLTAPEVVEAWCRIGRIPALRPTPEAEALLPEPTAKALALLKAADALQPYYDQYLTPRLAAEHKKTTQGLFAGTLTPAEAAARMAACAREAGQEHPPP